MTISVLPCYFSFLNLFLYFYPICNPICCGEGPKAHFQYHIYLSKIYESICPSNVASFKNTEFLCFRNSLKLLNQGFDNL